MAGPKTSSKPIYLCLHCGDRFVSKVELCSKCKTKEKRAAMDKENEEIFKERGLKFFCSYCARERREEEAKKNK
jgi:hypothetical protein